MPVRDSPEHTTTQADSGQLTKVRMTASSAAASSDVGQRVASDHFQHSARQHRVQQAGRQHVSGEGHNLFAGCFRSGVIATSSSRRRSKFCLAQYSTPVAVQERSVPRQLVDSAHEACETVHSKSHTITQPLTSPAVEIVNGPGAVATNEEIVGCVAHHGGWPRYGALERRPRHISALAAANQRGNREFPVCEADGAHSRVMGITDQQLALRTQRQTAWVVQQRCIANAVFMTWFARHPATVVTAPTAPQLQCVN